MNSFLRQSTASQSRTVGPFVDDTDFKTAETGLTIANTDVKLLKNGAASANKNSGGGTHRVNGEYSLTFDATDSDTVGELKVSIAVSGALPVFATFVVLEEAVYDALFAASAIGYVADQPVNATKFGGTTVTGRDIGASVLLSAGAGTGQLDFTSGVVKASLAQILGTAFTEGASGRIASAFQTLLNIAAPVFTVASVNQTGDSYARLGAPAGASVSVDIAAVKTDTGNLVTRITSTLFSGITSMAHWLGALAGKQAANATAQTEIRATGAGSGTYDATTDSLEANRDNLGTNGGALSLAKTTNITGFNDLSAAQMNAEADTALADYDAPTKAELDSAVAPLALEATAQDILTQTTRVDGLIENVSGDRFTAKALEEAPTGGSAPTAAAIADAVWDEALADHLAIGSTGNALNAAGSAGDPWSTALPGAYGSGTAGKIVGDNLNATVGSRATQSSVDDLPTNAELSTALASADDAVLAAIAALNNLSQANIRTAIGLASANLDTQLDALPTNAELATALAAADDAVLAAIAALNNLSQANVRAAVGLGSANLDTQLDALPTNAELAAALAAADDAVLTALAALNNLSAAQVKAQLVAALGTDTYPEPAAVPAATASLVDKINFLALLARNKQTLNKDTGVGVVRDDGDSADIGGRTDSDDGTTYTKGAWS